MKVGGIDREYEDMLIYIFICVSVYVCECVIQRKTQQKNKIKREGDWIESGFQVKLNIGLLPVFLCVCDCGFFVLQKI